MTKIEWADKTWNPITGCTKISEGCKNCYAERMSKRLAGRFGYPADGFSVAMHQDKVARPLRWKKPCTVFVCSMGDLFHKDVPLWYQATVFDIMAKSPAHTFLVLTKRADRMLNFLNQYKDPITSFRWPFSNVWLGVTAENQQRADERIPLLLQCSAAVRFVSVEPMLGPVYLEEDLWLGGEYYVSAMSTPDGSGVEYAEGLDWVICGGETGTGGRPMAPNWARILRDECKEADVPFFFKKMGQGQPTPADLMIREWPTQK